jgi:hypothetical protein
MRISLVYHCGLRHFVGGALYRPPLLLSRSRRVSIIAGIPARTITSSGDAPLNIGFAFGSLIHSSARFLLNRMFSALKIPIR